MSGSAAGGRSQGGPDLATRYYGPLAETTSDGEYTRYYYLGGARMASHTTTGASWQTAGLVDWSVHVARAPLEQPMLRLLLGSGAQALAAAGGVGLLAAVVLLPGRRRRAVGLRVRRGHALGTAILWAVGTLPWPIVLAPEPAAAVVDLWRHYHTDRLGSVLVVTDASGSNAENLRYTPYGDVRMRKTAGNANLVTTGKPRHEFTGYETETISKLEYAGARLYDPAFGSFLTHDPMRQFASPYTYTNWNPTNLTDPSGAFVEYIVPALIVSGLLAAVGSAIDAGIRTGDPGTAIGAFGVSAFFSLYTLAGGAIALQPVPQALQLAVSMGSIGYGAYGTYESFSNGNYATGAVSVMALVYGLYALASHTDGVSQLDQLRSAERDFHQRFEYVPNTRGAGDYSARISLVKGGPRGERWPDLPPGESVDANIQRTQFEAVADRGAATAMWIYRVRTGGAWDYKQISLELYEAAGNFNYGATGRVLFPENVLERAAGLVHIKNNGLDPSRGFPWGSRPFGDGAADNFWIRQGSQYYESRFE